MMTGCPSRTWRDVRVRDKLCNADRMREKVEPQRPVVLIDGCRQLRGEGDESSGEVFVGERRDRYPFVGDNGCDLAWAASGGRWGDGTMLRPLGNRTGADVRGAKQGSEGGVGIEPATAN